MKKLIFILLSVMSFAITVAQATTASGCINNAGHISLTVDSTHHVIKDKWEGCSYNYFSYNSSDDDYIQFNLCSGDDMMYYPDAAASIEIRVYP